MSFRALTELAAQALPGALLFYLIFHFAFKSIAKRKVGFAVALPGFIIAWMLITTGFIFSIAATGDAYEAYGGAIYRPLVVCLVVVSITFLLTRNRSSQKQTEAEP